jgi:YegS/Rv2252/BmrU family lipid kinase
MTEKNIKLIYNPAAGDKSFPKHLDTFIAKFQQAGFRISIFRTMESGDFSSAFSDIDDNFKAVIVAGGDGSANNVLNIMKKNEVDLPLGIIPAGTANDFASFLGMSQNIERSIDRILRWNIKEIDIGIVNGRYFLNVCVGGIISNIAHGTETEMKNRLGKVAYYLYGLKELPNLKPMSLKISTSDDKFENDFLAFFVFNSKDAGGFKNIAQNASVDDGLFDFIAVKAGNILKVSTAAAEIFQGNYVNNNNLIYIQDNYFKIEEINRNNKNDHCDIDGEKGPKFPLEIKLLPKALKVFTA